MIFADRAEAGERLAEQVAARVAERGRDVLVLGIPRGGVVVAAPVARALQAPLDVIVPRKLGAPDNPELAIGALAVADGDDIVVLDEDSLQALRIPPGYVERTVAAERAEIARRLRAYRGDRPPEPVAGRLVVMVDDGLATGLTARAAADAVLRQSPRDLLIAVPVAPRDTVSRFVKQGLRVEAVATPSPFESVGRFYGSFGQVEDEDVRALLP